MNIIANILVGCVYFIAVFMLMFTISLVIIVFTSNRDIVTTFPIDVDMLKTKRSISISRNMKTYRVLFRVFDILLSTLFILVTLPLMLIFSICLFSDTKGPVFTSRQIYGEKGRTIRLFQFRTINYFQKNGMRDCGQEIDEKKRSSVIERFLWKTGFYLIPRFFNVIIGDISLIGLNIIDDVKIGYYCNSIPKFCEPYSYYKPGFIGMFSLYRWIESRTYSYPEMIYLTNIVFLEKAGLKLILSMYASTIMNLSTKK